MTGRSDVADLAARIVDEVWRNGSEHEDGAWPDAMWNALETAELPLVGVDPELGGSGGTLADACDILWEMGAGGVPLPIAETGLLGGWALASAGLSVPRGPLAFAIAPPGTTLDREGNRWRLTARLARVPWAVRADDLVIVVHDARGDVVCRVPNDQATVVPGSNLAREPRDHVTIDLVLGGDAVAPLPGRADVHVLRRRGALSRAVLMAGALERVACLTVRYTNDRSQFGKPVITFQAVAGLVVQAVEHAVATCATVRAAIASGDQAAFEIAVAKQQASEAASIIAKLAHQAHGAIGMTAEYELGNLTRRLWCWRQEYGTEREWASWIGSYVVGGGADELWPLLTSGDLR